MKNEFHSLYSYIEIVTLGRAGTNQGPLISLFSRRQYATRIAVASRCTKAHTGFKLVRPPFRGLLCAIQASRQSNGAKGSSLLP